VATLQSDFLGDRKVVLRRVFPIDEVDGFRDLSGFGFDRHAVSEQLVDRFIVLVQATVVVAGFNTQVIDRSADLQVIVARPVKIVLQQPIFDIGVAWAVSPVA